MVAMHGRENPSVSVPVTIRSKKMTIFLGFLVIFAKKWQFSRFLPKNPKMPFFPKM
jgi:hypothetical protein